MRTHQLFQSLLFASVLLLLLRVPAAANSILVIPFENAARVADLDWVGESFAETLTERLAGPGRRLVTRQERMMALERLGLPATVALTRATVLRMAEGLEIDWVVLGRFEVNDGQLGAEAQLLDLRNPSLSPVIGGRGSFAQLLEVQGQLAWKILRWLDPTFSLSQEAFQQQFPRRRVTAFESYVRGLLALSREQQSRYFLQAARLQPDYSDPAFRLAQLYFQDQDYNTAARWFEKIPADDPLGLEARFYLALCYFHIRAYARARDTLAPLAERLPGKPVWNNLGVFASRQESGADALDYFSRAQKADPADPNVYFNLGLHYARQQRWEEAVDALDQCVKLDPDDTEGHFLRALALEGLGREQEAKRARQRAVGDNPGLLLSLERRQFDLDRLVENFTARLAGQRGQKESPPAGALARARHVDVHVKRGKDFLHRGQVEEAQGEFTEAILVDPDSHEAHLSLAEIYRRQGRLSQAVAELEASLWSQETVRARLQLAEIYLSQNRPAEARKQVEAALKLDPKNPGARALEQRLAAQPAAEEAKPQ